MSKIKIVQTNPILHFDIRKILKFQKDWIKLLKYSKCLKALNGKDCFNLSVGSNINMAIVVVDLTASLDKGR